MWRIRMNSLILWFSRKGMNYVDGKITSLPKGNVEKIVEILKQITNADSFEIVRKESYSKDYRECVNESVEELKANARPALLNALEDVQKYDMIYVVGPCWCGHYPMPIATQLEQLDFSGKQVRFIISHEGSGLASAKEDLLKWCKNADVKDGLAIRGTHIDANKILDWVKGE